MPHADVFLEAPDVATLAGPDAWDGGLVPVLSELLASQPGLKSLSERQLADALRSLRQVAVGVEFPQFSGGAALRFADREPAETLIAALGLPAHPAATPGVTRFAAPDDGARPLEALFYAADRTLLLGDADFIARAAAVASGAKPPLALESDFVARRARAANPHGLTVLGDFTRLGPSVTPQGLSLRAPWQLKLLPPPSSSLVVDVPVDGGLAGLTFSLPTKLDLAARLPKHTIAYLAFSSRGEEAPAERFRKLMEAAAPMLPDPGAFDEALKALSLSGTDLLSELGSQGVLAVVLDPTPDASTPAEQRLAFVLVQEMASARSYAKFGRTLDELSRRASQDTITRDASSWRSVPKNPKTRRPSALVAFAKTTAIAGIGNLRALERSLDAIRTGKDALGTSGTGDSVPRLGSLVLRPERVSSLLSDADRTALSEEALARLARAAPLVLHYSGEGEGTKRSRLRLELFGGGMFGPLSEISLSSVRRYVARAKASEATNTVRSMARAAQAAFEHSGGPNAAQLRRPCGSAEPVPRDVPRRTTYLPSQAAGRDFNTGAVDGAGWSCLHFNMKSPIRYRYSYRAGGGYLGPARGGPDPGPDGFEVAAEGDLDGDGITSLFTITGQFDPTWNSVLLSSLFAVDEFE